MSATLTATVESLHIAAAQKLLELLQTEKDPSLLARLIATAFRFKLPRLPGGTRSGPPTPTPPRNRTTPADQGHDAGDSDATPPAPPYTEEEYGALVVKYGEDRAADMNDRREALIAQFNRARSAANSS